MQEWFASLDINMRVLWGIALFSSIVFVLQSIMTFIGMDSEVNFDADFDGDMSADHGEASPFQLYTFRNLINFLLGFSWTGICLYDKIENRGILLLSAILVGILLVFFLIYLFLWLSGMQQSGTIKTAQTVGSKGSVYITIPAARSGEGKVQITVRGAVREYNAVTNDELLPNMTPIEVTAVINEQTLLVKRAQ